MQRGGDGAPLPYHRERQAKEWPAWSEHWAEYRAQYYGMISLIDTQLGRIVRRLGELGARR